MSKLNTSQYRNEKEAVQFTIKTWAKIILLSDSKEESYVLNGYNPASCPLCTIYPNCINCVLFGKLQAKGDDYLPVDRCGGDGSACVEAIRLKDKDVRLKGATHIIKELKNYLEQLK